MDYVPPPELRPHHAFVTQAQDHAERELFLRLFFTLKLADKAYMQAQGRERLPACLQQLQQTGLCEQTGIRSVDGKITMNVKLDRSCVLIDFNGAGGQKMQAALPPAISALLPGPVGKAAPALVCQPVEAPAVYNGTGVSRYGRASYHFG